MRNDAAFGPKRFGFDYLLPCPYLIEKHYNLADRYIQMYEWVRMRDKVPPRWFFELYSPCRRALIMTYAFENNEKVQKGRSTMEDLYLAADVPYETPTTKADRALHRAWRQSSSYVR